MTKVEFLKEIKSHLRNNKNEWYNKQVQVDDHIIGLKFYNKSIQRMEKDGISYGGLYDIPTQKQFIAEVEKMFD